MGRAPCCDKDNVKRGPWSPEEDAKLKSYIEKHGTGGNWIALPQKIGLKRCGKSCRLRWLNYLRPNLKHGGFSEEEDNIICSLYISIGSRWSIIAAQLPGRTDNDIKNYWNTRLKKKLLGKQHNEQPTRRGGGLMMEMNRSEIGSPMASAANCSFHQDQCSPELNLLAPTPYSNKESRLNDHSSIKKVLIKLVDYNQEQLLYNTTNQQYSSDVSAGSYTQQLYDPCVNISPSASMEALKDRGAQIEHALYTPDEARLQMMQGESSTFVGDLEEMGAYSDLQRLDGLDWPMIW